MANYIKRFVQKTSDNQTVFDLSDVKDLGLDGDKVFVNDGSNKVPISWIADLFLNFVRTVKHTVGSTNSPSGSGVGLWIDPNENDGYAPSTRPSLN